MRSSDHGEKPADGSPPPPQPEPDAASIAVAARNVSKTFFIPKAGKGFAGSLRYLLRGEGRYITAVDDISFTVAKGDFVGYIGPNGAGKSTTIKMLCGILHPSRGKITVAGFSPQQQRREVAQRIGVVFGQRTQLWWDLPVRDSYDLLAAMYGVPDSVYRARLAELEEMLDLSELMSVPVRKLSLGQRMRADIAGALLHAPEVLFLDEPTIGLDIVARRSIRAFLRELNARGTTILLTTHDLHDIEELCRRVMVINRGRLLFSGTTEELKQELGSRTTLTVDFAAASGAGADGDVAAAATAAGAVVVSWDGARLVARFDRHSVAAGSLINRLSAVKEIRDLYISEPDIEEVVEAVYRHPDCLHTTDAGTDV
jgi:ABC-2 type transport system ATP-binding protein